MVRRLLILCLMLSIPGLVGVADATVEWNLDKTLKLGSAPLDVALAPDGSSTYVLTDGGTIIIYSGTGQVTDTLNIGKSYDGLKISRDGSKLFLSNRTDKTLDIIDLSFVYKINTFGSPAIGKEGAPVTIALFSDFQ